MTTFSRNLNDANNDVFGGINLLTSSLNDLDDRGLVLSLSAFAEDTLGVLLKASLIPCEAAEQLIEGFNAPLGTFSARIKSAYALGLITKEQYLDLERLRKIRNEFAHSWRPISLSQQKLANLVNAMSYSRIDDTFPNDVTKKLRTSISCLLVEVRSCAAQIHEKGKQAQLVGTQFIAGFSGKNFDEQFSAASEKLDCIVYKLSNSEGEELKFYQEQLKGFSNRIFLLRASKPEDESNLQSLKNKVKSALYLI